MFKKTKVVQIKKERFDAFMEEYKKLVEKHRLDLTTELIITKNGIVPHISVVDIDEIAKANAKLKK